MSEQLYRPAEACKMAEVAPYVLRYWETEFPALSEGREKGTTRFYTERDVKIIARIRELLYDEGFTVAGAKKRLDSEIAGGRFDDGLKAAPSPEKQREQRRATSTAHVPTAVSEAPTSAFLSEPESSRADARAEAFADRKRVVKELKEIVRILDRGKKR